MVVSDRVAPMGEVSKMVELGKKSDGDIANFIDNYERHKKTDDPFYHQLLEERARRQQQRQKLDLEKSLALLKQAAVEQRCLTYGDLAKESGVDWSVARHQMNGAHGHLDRLLELCHARGLPLMTAICVNQSGLNSGELERNALSGFAEGAKRVGRVFTEELAFHRRCRDECWEWGRHRHL